MANRITRLNHVAVVSKNALNASKLWKMLGAKVSPAVDLPEHGVKTIFVELNNTKVELLEPIGEKSPVSSFLEKMPSGGMHHVCFEVDNIRDMMKTVQNAGVRVLSDEPKIGAHGKPVVFLHPKDCGGVLVELEES